MRGYFAWDDEHLENSLDTEFKYTEVYKRSAGSTAQITMKNM